MLCTSTISASERATLRLRKLENPRIQFQKRKLYPGIFFLLPYIRRILFCKGNLQEVHAKLEKRKMLFSARTLSFFVKF